LKRALITGITGQDGSYLAELLLSKGYDVHGIVRRSDVEDAPHNLPNIMHLQSRITLHHASLDNHQSLYRVVRDVSPVECYHLAASSFVNYSFDGEFSVVANNFTGTHYLLSSLKEVVPDCRIYFAGSSEMFGQAEASPQNEMTPFRPRSIYGISKLSGYHLVCNYRDRYNTFACSGILFNHESPRRGHKFVTRKITSSAAKIKLGLQAKVALGNLEAVRDWGYAPEYVHAMWLMLQQPMPQDYVIATGKTHSVREFARIAFERVGLDYQDHIVVDQKYYRESEKIPLCGDAAKAREILHWAPVKGLNEIIHEMVDNDVHLLKVGDRPSSAAQKT